MQSSTSDWKEDALRHLTEGKSIRETADLVGRSHWTVAKLLQREELIRAAAPHKGGRRPMSDYPILSEEHRQAGIRLNNHRELKLRWNLDEMARHLGSNRSRVQMMEQGRYDFTLRDLRAISELLGIDLMALLAPFNKVTEEIRTPRDHPKP